jgi:hypothetical protein
MLPRAVGRSARSTATLAVVAVALLTSWSPALAHRSGCHRWHSCPSDTGSDVCGDLGHCSACPDNEYCEASQPKWTSAEERKPSTSGTGVAANDTSCPSEAPIKGNFTPVSRERCIYHMPSQEYYDRTKPERCYATEAEAQQDGCRASKR